MNPGSQSIYTKTYQNSFLGFEIRKAVDEKGDGVYATKEFKGKVFLNFPSINFNFSWRNNL